MIGKLEHFTPQQLIKGLGLANALWRRNLDALAVDYCLFRSFF